MKGTILSGGNGTRLHPLTKITSKQLLPVYNKPMIMYPLQTLLDAGIRDILIIVAPEHSGDYLELLGSGEEFGAKFTFEIQAKPEGLAQAFIIGENFIDGDSVCMILGDNIFEDDFSDIIKGFSKGAQVFIKRVRDPERFGVAVLGAELEHGKMKVIGVQEKPKSHISDYAITGLYIYDNRVVEFAKQVKPSARGELEITELHDRYLKLGELDAVGVMGEWFDAGTFESLFFASEMIRKKSLNDANMRI